jgi:hypothetical protein
LRGVSPRQAIDTTIQIAVDDMFIARWFTLACFVVGGTAPRLLTAQSSADSSASHVHVPSMALWGSLGLGSGGVAPNSTAGLAGIAKINLSVGPVMLCFRTTDVGPFISAGDGVRDNGLLGGVRSRGRRMFASAALGFANASHYHQSDQNGPELAPSAGVLAYDVTAHANLLVLGAAVSFSGNLGPAPTRYSAVTVGLEVGWFGR